MTFQDTDIEARLTAYALGELDADETALVEQYLADHPDAAERVEQTRATAGLLERALHNESTPVADTAVAGRIGGERGVSRWIILAAAASVVAGLTVGLVILTSSGSRNDSRLAVGDTAAASVEARNNTAGDSLEIVDGTSLGYLVQDEAAQGGPSPMTPSSPGDRSVLAARNTAESPSSAGGGFGGGGLGGGGGGAMPAMVPPTEAEGLPGRSAGRTRTRGVPAGGEPNAAASVREIRDQLTRIERQTTPERHALEVKERDPNVGLYLEPDGRGDVDRGFYAAPTDREAYDRIVDNPFLRPTESPMSTFSVDVDTASYANVRRFLNSGQLPPPDAVRIEELINYFTYDYPNPTSPEEPFAADIEVVSAPWNPEHRLVRVGLQAMDVSNEERPGANLVFLIDVSGSMQDADKLPLVQRGMQHLVEQLDQRDSVAIVVYAGNSGVVLEPTTPDDIASKQKILAAIERLSAGGSTNGAAGITEAYEMAQKNFREGGVNRVILATDGDFNVGVTDRGQLTRLIEEKAESGVFLSILGFGQGNLQDATMEELSNKGDGFYAYIDGETEAQRVLGERMLSTVQAVAKDVKIQVEFNPKQVGAYRLIGYANRLLEDRDFNDDTKDAGDTGAGHQVTAFYEIIPPAVLEKENGERLAKLRATLGHLKDAQASVGQTQDGTIPYADEIVAVEQAIARIETTQLAPETDESRYLQPATVPAEVAHEMMTIKLRWKSPDEAKVQGTSEKIEWPVVDDGKAFDAASRNTQFAATVVGFGMLLRDSDYAGTWTWDDLDRMVQPLRELAKEADLTPEGVRQYVDFPELVRKAKDLSQ